jgi:tartrate dehydrogenase/decarboxylase/D-malate dehydrogenase
LEREGFSRANPNSALEATDVKTHPYRIAVIAGDGIGREVIPAGRSALEAAARGADVSLAFDELPWGSDYYRQHGRMMPADGFDQLATYDAIYLGAIGSPGVPDGVSAGMILAIRQKFDQYVNLRPMRLLKGLSSPLANRGPADIEMICVRENSEGEYAGVGGRIHVGTSREVAQQTGVFTRAGVERILRFGFELAATRPRKLLASATKSNALTYSMVMWDEIAEAVRKDYPSVEYRKYHVDALAARMVTHPQTLDVLVTSNLFGDILTDIGSAISGSLGIAPGANLNPERTYPSMFEPIHGSAPDIADKGIANPIGAIWAGALMIGHLGRRDLHDRIVGAIERVVAAGNTLTPDLGGTSTTADVSAAVCREVSGAAV